MDPNFETRLAGCTDPGPKPAAANEIAIAVIEQRPILNTTGSLSLDLGVEFSWTWASVSLPRESMSAVTAGSPHNSIARGRCSILHDRAASRPGLTFSISAVTAAEDRQKTRYHGSCYNPNQCAARKRWLALQAGMVGLATSSGT